MKFNLDYDLKTNTALLSKPFNVLGVPISNRMVAQPMERTAGTIDGKLSPFLVKSYKNLAKGQWGILHLEAMSVMKKYRSRKGQLVINEENRASFKKFIEDLKKISPDTKFFFQITFPGMVAGEGQKKTTIIPRVHEEDPNTKLLEDEEIKEIQDAFKKAVEICIDIGADGVDIKGCHGYLVVEFLRPSNTRPGKFGGSFSNRTRFFKDIFIHTKKYADDANHPDFLIGSRVSVYESIIGGFGTGGPDDFIEDLSEPKQYASLMHDWGAKFINVTAGIPAMMPEVTRPSKDVPWGIWNHFRLTKEIKMHLDAVNKPMMVIGSAYSMLQEDLPYYAGKNIESKSVDVIGLGRQTLADPLYPKKLFENQNSSINYCVGCNNCARLLVAQKIVGCAYHDDEAKQRLKEK